jgi:hypothetical protein
MKPGAAGLRCSANKNLHRDATMETTKSRHRRPSSDPIIRMRTRLDELATRISDLKHRHRDEGDVTAGRLVRTLESEEADIQAVLKGAPRRSIRH